MIISLHDLEFIIPAEIDTVITDDSFDNFELIPIKPWKLQNKPHDLYVTEISLLIHDEGNALVIAYENPDK